MPARCARLRGGTIPPLSQAPTYTGSTCLQPPTGMLHTRLTSASVCTSSAARGTCGRLHDGCSGSWGCGVFGNQPPVVADLWNSGERGTCDSLEWRGRFTHVVSGNMACHLGRRPPARGCAMPIGRVQRASLLDSTPCGKVAASPCIGHEPGKSLAGAC